MVLLRPDLPAGPSSRVPLLSAAAYVDTWVDGQKLGADDHLGKPFNVHEMVALVGAPGFSNAVTVIIGRPRRKLADPSVIETTVSGG